MRLEKESLMLPACKRERTNKASILIMPWFRTTGAGISSTISDKGCYVIKGTIPDTQVVLNMYNILVS